MYMRPPTGRRTAGQSPIDETLNGIKESIQYEKSAQAFYTHLIDRAPDEQQRTILKGILKDEYKQCRMLRNIYKELTGLDVTVQEDGTTMFPETYMEGLNSVILYELSAMERYRSIYMTMPNETMKNQLFEILTDEMKHAILINYLINLNQVVKD